MDVKKKNQIKDLVKMCVDNKLDFLKVGDIEIKKSIHYKPTEIKGFAQSKVETEEELLYWSSTPNVQVKL